MTWTVNLTPEFRDFVCTVFLNFLSHLFQRNGCTYYYSESGWDPSHGVSGITFSSEDDYEIATCIRTSIIPASVRWYTGEAAEDDFSRHLQDIPEEDGVSVFDTPVCGPSACAVTVTKVAETEAVAVMKQSEQGGPHRSPI